MERVNARPDEIQVSATVAALLNSWVRDPNMTDDQRKLFRAQVTVLLADYPPEVLVAIVHPKKGLPGNLKWFPSVAEVREACDRAFASLQKAAAEDLAKMRQRPLLAAPPPETPEQRARAAARWEQEIRPALKAAEPDEVLAPPETPAEKLARLTGRPVEEMKLSLWNLPDSLTRPRKGQAA